MKTEIKEDENGSYLIADGVPILHVEPLDDRIFAVSLGDADKTPGGIIIPDMAKPRPKRAVVVSVGPGKWENGSRKKPSVKPGTVILHAEYSGATVTIGAEDFKTMSEAEIYGRDVSGAAIEDAHRALQEHALREEKRLPKPVGCGDP